MTPDLDAIRTDVISCQRCGLCNTRTNAVPGTGRHDADIMLVGEAPGRSEDARGSPFVGAAGARLTYALDKAGLARDKVYITNVVKCRPPENRVPTAAERQECSAYLQAEIAAIDPHVICVLGNTAFGSILGGSEITKNRGKTASMNDRLYFITIHPAATIYNQDMVGTFEDDIRRLVDIAQRLRNGQEVTPDIEYPSRRT